MDEIKFDGNKLFTFRKEKGFSQEKLALAIGVSRQTIYLWESNQSLPDVEKVSKICKILEINLSDLVDGVEEHKSEINNQNDNINNEEEKEKDNLKPKQKQVKKIILKICAIILVVIIIIYFIISTIKFIRLKHILDKWEDLDELNSYYMKVNEFFVNNNNDRNFEKVFYEKYFNDNILTTVWREPKDNLIELITIYDYKENYKYLINENQKTYRKEKLDANDEEQKLTYDFRRKMNFSNNNLLNYIFCLNPEFNIFCNDSYELRLNDKIKKSVDFKTGFVKSEETLDSENSRIERYYEVELNTDKTFEINLDEYTEVTE